MFKKTSGVGNRKKQRIGNEQYILRDREIGNAIKSGQDFTLPMQGVRGKYLIREIDSTCCK